MGHEYSKGGINSRSAGLNGVVNQMIPATVGGAAMINNSPSKFVPNAFRASRVSADTNIPTASENQNVFANTRAIRHTCCSDTPPIIIGNPNTGTIASNPKNPLNDV